MSEFKYGSIMEGLKDIHDRSKSIGDDILELAKISGDVDIKAIVTDLSNSAYGLAIDCRDAAETYEEIMSSEDTEVEEDLEVEIPEDLEILTDEDKVEPEEIVDTETKDEEELEVNN